MPWQPPARRRTPTSRAPPRRGGRAPPRCSPGLACRTATCTTAALLSPWCGQVVAASPATSITTLPTARPSATQRSAAAVSSSVKVAPMCGRTRPLSSRSRSSASLRCSASGSWVAKPRNSKPRTSMPFSSTRLSGIRGIVARRVADAHEPAAVAQRAQRRFGEVAADRVDDDVGAVRAAPPRSAARRSASPCRTSVRRAVLGGDGSSFSSDDATAVTVAPSATPSCTAARPTPPPAPSTTSSSPGARRAVERSTWMAVRWATPAAAASASESPAGDRA